MKTALTKKHLVTLFWVAAAFGSLFLAPAVQAADPTMTALQTASGDQDATSYVIGPQNVIQIKIFGDSAGNQIYRVDERGYIKHALLGSLNIGGMTVAAAEEVIEARLADGYFVDPRVTIFVLQHSTFSVLGEVRKPGTYEIYGRTTVIEAISLAGGFTPVANQRALRIIRKSEDGESAIEVDATRITGQGDTSANVAIEADDVISVPKSFF